MKLILCKYCGDVFKLTTGLMRLCECGQSKGYYKDELNAVVEGWYAIPIGFNNSSLVEAVRNQPKEGMGYRFDAFVIPEECDTIEHK